MRAYPGMSGQIIFKSEKENIEQINIINNRNKIIVTI